MIRVFPKFRAGILLGLALALTSTSALVAQEPIPTLTLFSLNMNFQGKPLPNSNFTATTVVVGLGQKTLQLFENTAVTAAITANFAKPGETVVYNGALSQAQKTPIVTTFSVYNIFL